jgi:hypothetical protein
MTRIDWRHAARVGAPVRYPDLDRPLVRTPRGTITPADVRRWSWADALTWSIVIAAWAIALGLFL